MLISLLALTMLGPDIALQDPPAPQSDPLPATPAWAYRPQVTSEDFPAGAKNANIPEGRAVIQCMAPPEGGQPTDCEIVSESPDGHYFGTAGLIIMRRGQLRPYAVREDGRPYRVSQVFSFMLGDYVPPTDGQ